MSTQTNTTKHAFDLDGFPFTFSDACGIAQYIRRVALRYVRGGKSGSVAMQRGYEAIALMSSTVSLYEAVRANSLGKRVETAITCLVAAAGESVKHAGGKAEEVEAAEQCVVRRAAFWLRDNTDWR